MLMIRADSVESRSLTETAAVTSRNSETKAVATTNPSEEAKENPLKSVKGIGHVRPVATAISPGEQNASVAMLERMELKVHRLADNPSERGSLKRHAKGTGHVQDAITATSLGEQNANAAMPGKTALQLLATEEADSVADAEGEETVVEAVELLVADVVDSTNHSEGSKTKASRQQTRRSSLTNKHVKLIIII